MSLALLTPWQQLLWLVGAVILIVPLVTWGVVLIIRGYFNAKEQHLARMLKALADTIIKISEDATIKMNEALAKLKNQTESKKPE